MLLGVQFSAKIMVVELKRASFLPFINNYRIFFFFFLETEKNVLWCETIFQHWMITKSRGIWVWPLRCPYQWDMWRTTVFSLLDLVVLDSSVNPNFYCRNFNEGQYLVCWILLFLIARQSKLLCCKFHIGTLFRKASTNSSIPMGSQNSFIPNATFGSFPHLWYKIDILKANFCSICSVSFCSESSKLLSNSHLFLSSFNLSIQHWIPSRKKRELNQN